MTKRFTFKREAKVLFLVSGFTFFAYNLLLPFYAVFVAEIGGDLLDVGYAFATFSIASGVFVFLFGTSDFFLDRIRVMTVVGYITITAGQAGYFFVENPVQLLIVQVIIGLGLGILEPSFDAVFAGGLSEKDAGKQWASWAGAIAVIAGISSMIGGYVLSNYSFAVLFYIMLVFNLLGILSSLSLLKEHESDRRV